MDLSYSRQQDEDDDDDDDDSPQIYNYLHLKSITFIFLNSFLLDLKYVVCIRSLVTNFIFMVPKNSVHRWW